MPTGLLRRILITGYCSLLAYAGLVLATLLLRRFAPQADWLSIQVDEYRLILAVFLGLMLANALGPLVGV